MSKSTTSTRSNSVETPGENDASAPLTQLECSAAIDESVQQFAATAMLEESNDGNDTENTGVPTSPPPSYERVLEETRLAAELASDKLDNENCAFDLCDLDNDDDQCDENDCMGDCVAGCEDLEDDEDEARRPQILHKSSKELYKAVAKQFGITCKMSDQCRCLDCQSHYFECEYDYNEQEKTDGGLGAGTPMFISEVMHGTACVIL